MAWPEAPSSPERPQPYEHHMSTLVTVARQQVLVQLNDVLLRSLDVRSERTGQSRSEIIREALTAHLHDEREEAIDAALIAGYTAIPPDTPDEWGPMSTGLLLDTPEPWDDEDDDAHG